MERKMRRPRKLLDEQVSKEILSKATNGVLSLVDVYGAPYGVPLSYVYDGEGSVYFHSAVMGHKIECIKVHSPCSFCVVSQHLFWSDEIKTVNGINLQ